jgi:hypothetical protein
MNFANINIGTTPDDHTGDPLRVAFAKINENFANIATAGGVGVNTVAGRTGNVLLSVNDVAGAVSVGSVGSLVASSLSNISVPTFTQVNTAIASTLTTAEAYTDSAIANLSLNAPTSLQTFKQLADAIGDNPQFYLQVASLDNAMALANASIATTQSNINLIWTNLANETNDFNTALADIALINANVTAANSAVASTNTYINSVNTGLGLANAIIATNTASIASLNTGLTVANTAIASLQSNAAAQEFEISSLVTEVNALNAELNSVNIQLGTDTVGIAALNSGLTLANTAIAGLQSNIASQQTQINNNTANISLVNSNVAMANTSIVSLLTTTSLQTAQINNLSANITAANTAIAALQSAGYATTGYVTTQINALVNGAPGALDTLKELADALGDDANFNTHYLSTIGGINANVTAANSAITLLNGTTATLNADITAIDNQLTTGNITTTGNVSANRLVTVNGIFWSNGTPFVSGSNQAVNTGNISFSGYTISTVNDIGGNFGITLHPANGGEVHISSNTGINNTNPAYWLEVGNQLDNNNTGAIAVDFSNGSSYNSSTVLTYDWADGSNSSVKHANIGLYSNGNIAQGLIVFDAFNSPANAIVVNSIGLNFNANTFGGNLDLNYALTANSAVLAPALPSSYVPGFPLFASLNGNTRPYTVATLTNTVAKFVGTDTGNAVVSIDGYGAGSLIGPGFETRSARGTIASPTASQSNDVLGRYVSQGFGSTRYGTGFTGGMIVQSEGNFTDTSYPTAIVFYTTSANVITPRQAGRFSSTGNLLLNNGTPSTSVNSGALTIVGGAGVSGNVYAGSFNTAGTITSYYGTIGNLNINGATASVSTTTGALVVTGGVGISGNLNVLGSLQAGTTLLNGQLTINSSIDPAGGASGALNIVGGAVVGGNVLIDNQLFIGTNSLSTQLTNSVIAAKTSSSSGAGTQYAQAALTNTAATGSSDWIAYGDNYPGPNNDHGWMDMGYTGSGFNDPAFTITKPNDGYLFTGAVAGSGLGGNLVLATDNTGTYKDIVFATGSFYANAEVARFHGNTINGGTFTVQSDILAKGKLVLGAGQAPATSTSAGVAGQVAYDANYVYVCVATNTWKRTALSTW